LIFFCLFFIFPPNFPPFRIKLTNGETGQTSRLAGETVRLTDLNYQISKFEFWSANLPVSPA
jgi:hypothetical protein